MRQARRKRGTIVDPDDNEISFSDPPHYTQRMIEQMVQPAQMRTAESVEGLKLLVHFGSLPRLVRSISLRLPSHR